MNFRVLWEEKALAELNEIWTRAIDREGVELAAKRIDIELTYIHSQRARREDLNTESCSSFPSSCGFASWSGCERFTCCTCDP